MVSRAVDDDITNIIVSQLYLDVVDPTKDIVMNVNSPGGSIKAGIALFDYMRYIWSDVSSICIGLTTCVRAFLLSVVTKWKRYSLLNSMIMIHQPLGGAQGSHTDIDIQVVSHMVAMFHGIVGREVVKNHGGTAVLHSTALMLSVPTQIAGCKIVVFATPPAKGGSICKEILYCAKKAGVTHIFKAEDAQTISVMAWGTESCSKVEKIYGPGNQYVTAAKMILQNSEAMISIDMPAGPSEVLFIADKHANPVHIAADLLSQAEHGPGSQVVLVVAGDVVDITAIEDQINKQCNSLPHGSFAAKALSHIFIVHAHDMIAFLNLYAPEHLIINVTDAEKWESFVEKAGSVFLGEWTLESLGDYASGTNHVLPTYGYARMYSGVSLDSFLKYITVQSLVSFPTSLEKIVGVDISHRALAKATKLLHPKLNRLSDSWVNKPICCFANACTLK
ncbi:hypothetical protein ACS0TY_033723 [Phlomoides rotata]